MTDDVFIDFILGSFVGLLAWFFGGLDGLMKILLALCVIDYCSGTCVAWYKNILSSSIGFRGIVKKCIMLTFVGIAHLLDIYIVKDFLGGTGIIRPVVCMFYISNEGLSIIENADKLGIPIPQILRSKLLHLKSEHNQEHKKRRKKDNSNNESKKSA